MQVHACAVLRRFEEVALSLFWHAAQLLAFPLWFEVERMYLAVRFLAQHEMFLTLH